MAPALFRTLSTMLWLALIGALAADEASPETRATKDRWSGFGGALAGAKLFYEGTRGPAHPMIGFRVDAVPPGWPMALTLDATVASRTGKEDDLATWQRTPVGGLLGDLTVESDFGLRYHADLGERLGATFGAGACVIYARFDYKGLYPLLGPMVTATLVDRDTGWGEWAGAGLRYRFGTEGWSVGLEAKASSASVVLIDHRHDAGGVHVGITADHAW